MKSNYVDIKTASLYVRRNLLAFKDGLKSIVNESGYCFERVICENSETGGRRQTDAQY